MLKGHVTISRPHGDQCNYINIEIVDKLSGIQFVECHIEYADFAEAITGLGHTDCNFILRGLDGVGKTRETKSEKVFVPCTTFGGERKEAAAKAIAKYEVDGWVGRVRDATNQHRITKHTDDGYYATVHFSRLVETPPAPART